MTKRRRLLLAQAVPRELYPIGTDVVQLYIGSQNAWQIGRIDYKGDWNGSADQTVYGSQVYIPILPTYRFAKNAFRLANGGGRYCAWYDENKQLISTFTRPNMTAEALPAPPANAYYLRICTGNWSNATQLTITRTA